MTWNNRVRVWKQRQYDGQLTGQWTTKGCERQPSVRAHSIWMTLYLHFIGLYKMSWHETKIFLYQFSMSTWSDWHAQPSTYFGNVGKFFHWKHFIMSYYHPRGHGFNSRLHSRNLFQYIVSGRGSIQPCADNCIATWYYRWTSEKKTKIKVERESIVVLPALHCHGSLEFLVSWIKFIYLHIYRQGVPEFDR